MKKLYIAGVHITLWTLLIILLFIVISAISIFIPTNSKSYDKIIKQAAAIYQIDEHDYDYYFESQKEMGGSWFFGGMRGYTANTFSGKGWNGSKVYIQKGMPRNVTVFAIFHEFAHVAQAKYIGTSYDDNNYSERQANANAHELMIKNGYWLAAFGCFYYNFDEIVGLRFNYIYLGEMFENFFLGTNKLSIKI